MTVSDEKVTLGLMTRAGERPCAWAPTRAYADAYRDALRAHDIAGQVEYTA